MNKKEFEKLEKYLQLRNEYTKQNPKDKEEIAFFEGVRATLQRLTDYKMDFDKITNKIINIESKTIQRKIKRYLNK